MKVLVITYSKGYEYLNGTKVKPVYVKNPFSGEEEKVYDNDLRLIHDEDYERAKFEYCNGKGWCWPFEIEEEDLTEEQIEKLNQPV